MKRNSIEASVFKGSGYKKNKIKVNHLNYTPKEKEEVLEVIRALKGTDLAATCGDYWQKVKLEIKNITEREYGAAGKN